MSRESTMNLRFYDKYKEINLLSTSSLVVFTQTKQKKKVKLDERL